MYLRRVLIIVSGNDYFRVKNRIVILCVFFFFFLVTTNYRRCRSNVALRTRTTRDRHRRREKIRRKTRDHVSVTRFNAPATVLYIHNRLMITHRLRRRCSRVLNTWTDSAYTGWPVFFSVQNVRFSPAVMACPRLLNLFVTRFSTRSTNNITYFIYIIISDAGNFNFTTSSPIPFIRRPTSFLNVFLQTNV